MSGIEKYRYTGAEEFNIKEFDTSDSGEFNDREEAVEEFVENLRKINKLQQKLYAERKEGVIFVFQAMDAAGKDGVIRTVFSTLSPHGVKEYCFKVPSSEESSHDYLWRFWSALPARGNISIFNRSYYEDVLVGKVHKLYENQTRPDRLNRVDIIRQRYGQIKDFEKYLYNTGTRVVKIFLNVSKDEQARRFISRIDTPKKNWKVSSGDIAEREYWDEYMDAFEKMVNTTSTKNSPWYVVPSDHKWYSRLIVSRIVLQTLIDMNPQYPVIEADEFDEAMQYRQSLIESIPDYAQEEEQAPEFSKTGEIAADIVLDEEQQKIAEKKEKLKDNGFRAIRELLAKGYILKSTDDIINAVAEAEDAENDECPSDEETENEELPFAENDELEHRIALEDAYERFNLAKAIKLSKKEKKFLKAMEELESDGILIDFFNVCDTMDIRPSKLDELIGNSMLNGLIDMDEEGYLYTTEFGIKSLYADKKIKKSDKKFRKFLKCLSTEELQEFISMCDEFPIDEEYEDYEEYEDFADDIDVEIFEDEEAQQEEKPDNN